SIGAGGVLRNVEIHLRSVFLQGLLVARLDDAILRLPVAARPLRQWAEWCARAELHPVNAALAIGRELPGVRVCVVGVDSRAQLQEITRAWAETAPISVPSLACESPEVIDPRRWTTAGQHRHR